MSIKIDRYELFYRLNQQGEMVKSIFVFVLRLILSAGYKHTYPRVINTLIRVL